MIRVGLFVFWHNYSIVHVEEGNSQCIAVTFCKGKNFKEQVLKSK